MDISRFCFIALFGLAIGVLSGLFGVGGGTMIVPMLNLVFGLPMKNASATSLFSIAPTSISGSYRHIKARTVNLPVACMFGIPGAITSTLSAGFSDRLPDWVALAATIGVLGFSAYRMFAEAAKPAIDETGRTAAPRFKSQATANAATIAIGTFAGLIAGIVGVGGGFIIVPAGMALLGMTMKEMSAISLTAIAIIALPGIATHAVLGHIYYLYGVALVAGTIPGAAIGVTLLPKIGEKTLRIAFGCLLVISGALLVLNRL